MNPLSMDVVEGDCSDPRQSTGHPKTCLFGSGANIGAWCTVARTADWRGVIRRSPIPELRVTLAPCPLAAVYRALIIFGLNSLASALRPPSGRRPSFRTAEAVPRDSRNKQRNPFGSSQARELARVARFTW